MLGTIRIGGICLLIAGTATVAAGDDEGPFRPMGFDQAKRAAAEGGKRLVLVDFYTTWCGPCKMLDQTTWKDQGVKDWLAKEAVCLKIDAEKETALADKYRITAYPTILLLRPDGSEVDRLVGYRNAKTFLAEARDALAGNDSLSRARKKLEGAGKDDPMLRMSYGDALAQKGRNEEALAEYLWCFDHGLEHNQAFAGVRVSFLLLKIAQLGRTEPSALDELRKRRDAALKPLEEGKGDFSAAMDFAMLNEYLGEPGKTLAFYDRLKGDKSASSRVLAYLRTRVRDQLLEAKRYKEFLDGTDAGSLIRQKISGHQSPLRRILLKSEDLRAFERRQIVADGAKYYEAMIGTGDKAGASEMAKQLVAFDRDAAYPALIAAARRAGDTRTAEELTAKSREASKPSTPK